MCSLVTINKARDSRPMCSRVVESFGIEAESKGEIRSQEDAVMKRVKKMTLMKTITKVD